MGNSAKFFREQHKKAKEAAKAPSNTKVLKKEELAKVSDNTKVLKLDNVSESPIPKIIHKVWMVFNQNKPGIPEKYKEGDIILKKLHPDYKFIQWDDKKIFSFVHDYYPDFYDKFIAYDEPIMRHDVARYLILKSFGGVFVQDSLVFQKNISSLFNENDKLVFSTKFDNIPNRKGELSNGFMASTPQHPFWDSLISNLQKASHAPHLKKNKVMSLTGPYILTETLEEYQNKNHDKAINILNHKYLFPFYASETSSPPIKENCIDAKNITQCFTIFPNAYAYCPWVASWTKPETQKQYLPISKDNTLQPFVMYDKLFVMSLVDYQDFPAAQQRWEKISATLSKLNIPYERFPAVNGYKTLITDPNGNTFTGKDIKNKIVIMQKNIPYKVLCDNKVNPPATITLSTSECKLMAGNIGTACTKALIRKEIIRHKLNYTVILEDDFLPTQDNFKQEINKLVASALGFDLVYLDCLFSKGGTKKMTDNLLLSTFNDNARWHGNWALLMSYEGAVKIDSGDTYVGCSSDRYAVDMHKGIIKKPGVSSFNSYYANYNFSALSVDNYSGHNANSISTQMGCRDYHPSNPGDCDSSTKIIGLTE